MSNIKVNDLKPTGADLFTDSEGFMDELSNDELEQTMGGLNLVAFPAQGYRLNKAIQFNYTYQYTTGLVPEVTIFTNPATPVIL